MKSESEKIAGSIILKKYGLFFKQQFQDFFESCDYQQTWENNRTFLPIQIILEPKEVIPMINLVSSDNTVITKVLAVFSSLCVEVINLKKEAMERHIPFLSIYDEYKESSITNQIKSICHLNAFVARCEDTLKNLFGQLFGLYAESFINLDGVELHYIINHIGELMTILILIELLISKTSLPKKWNIYYKNITNVNHKTDYTELSDEKIKFLHGTIENITEKIMSDTIVQNNLNNLLAVKSKSFEKGHTLIVAEFLRYVRLLISNLDKLVQENPQSTNMYKTVKANALFVLTSYVFGINDKKIFRTLIDLNVKAHSIHIAGKVLWFPEQFLLRHVPGLCESYGKMQQVILKARQSFIVNRKTSIIRDEFNLLNAVSQWNLKVEQFFDVTHVQLNASEINIHAKILISGLEIASHANYILLTLVNLHVSLGIPLSKNMLVSIFQMLESIKILRSTILRNHHAIINSINMVVQHYMYQIISCTANIKQNLMLDKNYANQKLDELTCIVVAERALRGAPTSERVTSAALALALLPAIACPEDSRANLGFLFEKIKILSNYLMTMHQLCDSSWIFWHQTLLPLYLSKTVLTDSTEAFRLQYTYTVLEDCAMLLHNSDKHFGITKVVAYQNNIVKLIDNLIMKTSCQQIETDLRLHIHSHLKLDVSNPFVNNILKKSLLFIDNFRLLQTYICVIPTVEHYLSTMYYNLTTVVLSNWKTYGEMRQMAEFKLNLSTVEDNLPTQTLEQGLDVLEIMRNIHVFVSKYLYNLNNQIFIEKSSNNKHLNSINIRHIANSIRTHGTGIMNTTVNFTYQFLKKKFQTFSQFMYDEQIKSRLNKDLKIFKDNFDTNGKMYCYKNAERFNRGIRNLGLDEDGQSYLDLFRDLISQIGNAMGYVRMIRSGGRHSCADAIVFLPSLNIDKTFTSLTDECSLRANTKEAAQNLDACIENLSTNFTKGTEYFSLLVDGFAPVFRNPKNIHLKNFYIIVPPLTLNFVEHLILSKDRMSKKNKVGAAFTDDGFAMGVAYILKLLDQDSNFESLHWFDSVEKYIKEARESLEEQKSKGSLQLHQTLALTEKKITTLEQEFKLLQYSLSSARIFFR